jgi:hypothetical protein
LEHALGKKGFFALREEPESLNTRDTRTHLRDVSGLSVEDV